MEYSIPSLHFPKKSLFSLCVSGVLDTICKEKMVIYSQLLILVTKLTLPSFNQYHFVTVSAYPNRKVCYCLFILIITILTGLFLPNVTLALYLMNAETTHHITSLAFCFCACSSGSRSRRSRTLFMASS